MRYFLGTIIIGLLLSACSQTKEKAEDHNSSDTAPIVELNDEQYPDNPDIAIRSDLDGLFSHGEISFHRKNNGNYDVLIAPKNESSDTIYLNDINLSEWIPTIPAWIQEDDYLSEICVVNQEWNRHQVKFFERQFTTSKQAKESEVTKRVDLARNCLNAYLWEIITYCEEDGELKPCYHGWFDFPQTLYASLFEERNKVAFSKYQNELENWIDPPSKHIDLSKLRHIYDGQQVTFVNHNAVLYPLVGERKKKEKNIVYPREYNTIQDFLNDSTRYATFTPPGYYNTSDPRVTVLGKLAHLQSVQIDHAISASPKKDSIIEIQLMFQSADSSDFTLMVIGLEESKIPTLSLDSAHKGYQMPMGIANHSFYESYEQQQKNSSLASPYYALLFDQNGNWIDSHKLGIDGPLFIKDKTTGNIHLYILSFERHSFVGHYEFVQ